MTTFIWSGHEWSRGALQLSKTLAIPRLRHSPGNLKKLTNRDRIINWGGTRLPDFCLNAGFVLNEPAYVRKASSKLAFFETVKDNVCVVPWFQGMDNVGNYLAQGKRIVARKTLNGSGGDGIVIISEPVDICEAPLYTVYVPKKYEFRIHVLGTEVIDIQRKIKRPDYQGEIDWSIRNHAGGFIFVRNGVSDMVPPDVLKQAKAAVHTVGLHFGAVDVIWNDKDQKAYVLEVNTAPGLEGITVQKYAEALEKQYGALLDL